MRTGQQRSLEALLTADGTLERRCRESCAHRVDRVDPRVQLFGVARLEQVLGLVSRVQPEHVLFLRVVAGLGGERVMNANGVVHVVGHLRNANRECVKYINCKQKRKYQIKLIVKLA